MASVHYEIDVARLFFSPSIITVIENDVIALGNVGNTTRI